MVKFYEDGLPYFYMQKFKTSTNWSIQNASIVFLKLAKGDQFFFSMQIIEFPYVTQQRNVFHRIDYSSM